MSINTNIICKIYKNIPQSKLLNLLIFVIKILPLFIITHDFNISFQKGISHYFRILALCDLFVHIDKFYLHIISFILLAIAITIIISFFFVIHNISKYDKLIAKHQSLLKGNTLTIFYVFYFFNQYIYSLCIEELFCPGIPVSNPHGIKIESGNECKTITYYLAVIIICFIVLFTLLASIIINCIHYDICFKSFSFNMVRFNTIDITFLLFPLFQAAIQLEYHIDFKTTIIIKNCIRAVFVLSYSMAYYSQKIPFTSFYLHYFFIFHNTMCFISCIIEWCFFYDISNYLEILTKSNILIIMKIVFEVVISKLMLDYYLYRERIKMEELIMTGVKGGYFYLSSIQKFFYFIYYRYKHVNWFISISKLALKAYKDNIHSPLCNQNCFFCNNFSLRSYQLQLNETLNEIEKEIIIYVDKNYVIKTNELSLKQTFPLFSALMQYIITKCYENNKTYSHNVRRIEASFICAMYYYFFEGNHYKSLFFIEQITKTPVYKEKPILRVQITLFRYKITKHYKHYNSEIVGKNNMHLKKSFIRLDDQIDEFNEKMKSSIIKEMHMNYKCIEKIIKGEKMLIDSVNEYLKIMELMYSDIITYKQYVKTIKTFKIQTQYNILNIPLIFNKESTSSLPYSPEKYWIYFSYFGNKNAKESEAIESYFRQNITMNQKNEYSVLVLNSIIIKDKISFKIEYISDSLLNILGYSSTEFKLLEFNQLLSTTFIKSYNYLLEQAIKTGQDRIYIKNFCLIDKERYAMMFHLNGITIYSQNTLKIFSKIEEAKEQMLINKNKKKKIKMKTKNSSTLNNYCGTCFLFAKKNGRIVSICRDFETMFYLTSTIISKHNINMKELLRVEQLNKEGTIERDLIVIFNNIIEINIMKVGSSGEDDFSKQVPLLKEALDIISALPHKLTVVVNYEEQQIPKSAKKNSKFYVFVLSISSSLKIHFKDADETTLGETICNSPSTLLKSNNFSSLFNYSTVSKTIVNKEEILELIYLIKMLSFKHLFRKYNLATNNPGLNHQIITFEGIVIKNKIEKRERTNQNEISDKGNNNKLKTDNETYQAKINSSTRTLNKFLLLDKYYPSMPLLFKILSYATFIIAFISILFLSIIRNNDFKLQIELFHFLSYIELSRSSVTYFLATIVYMLFQGNNLQKEIIDNDIITSYDYLIDNFISEFDDYEFLHASLVHFIFYYNKDFDSNYMNILTTLYPVILLNSNFTATKTKEGLLNLLRLSTMIRVLQDSEPVTVFFNQTNGMYLKGQSIDFYAEEIYVKVIENYNTVIQYVYLELINAFPKLVFQPIVQSRITISIISMICMIILAICGIIIIFAFSYYSQFVFAQHLFTFAELRYFYFYLERKTELILEYLKNNGEQKNMRNLLVLDYPNEKKKLNQQLSLFNENKDYVIKIKPFNCINSVLLKKPNQNEIQLSLRVTNDIEDFKSNIKWELNSGSRSKKSTAGLLGVIKSRASSKACVQPSSRISTQLFNKKMNNDNIVKSNSAQNTDNQTMERSNTGRLLNTSKTASSMASNVNLVQTSSSTSYLKTQINAQLGLNPNNFINDQNGKILIERPKDVLIAFAFFTLELLLILICGMADVIFTNSNLHNVMKLLSCQYTLLNQIHSTQHFLLTYQLSILMDKEITFDYLNHGYTNICSKTNYANTITNHTLFKELDECYRSSKEDAIQIATSPSYSSLLNIRKYLTEVNTDEFCNTFSNYPFEHSVEHLKMFTYAKTGKHLYEACQKIGFGLNSKGIDNALNSMYITLIDLYGDFLSDTNRNGASNVLRLNDPKVLSFQAEILEIFHLMPIQYLTAFSMDYDKFDWDYNMTTLVVTILELALILLAALQLYLLISRNSEEKMNIEFLDKCLIRTILF